MKFIVITISISLLTAFTISAHLKNGLYHHRSSMLSSKWWFVIIDDDTAYVNWVATHHWVKCGPVDTLYKQNDGGYSKSDKLMSINDGVLYRHIESNKKMKRVAFRLKKSGSSSIDVWNRMYPSIKESGRVREDLADAAHVLYLRYVSIINRE